MAVYYRVTINAIMFYKYSLNPTDGESKASHRKEQTALYIQSKRNMVFLETPVNKTTKSAQPFKHRINQWRCQASVNTRFRSGSLI